MPTPTAVRPPSGPGPLPGRPAAPPVPPRRRRRLWRGLGLALLVAAAALPVTSGEEAEAAGGRPSGPLVPAAGFYVGAYTKSTEGYGEAKQRAAIEDLESHLGRRLHIDHHFYEWSKVFPSQSEPWDIDHGRIPMISWNGAGVLSSTIAAGHHDGMIRARAEAVRRLGAPVFIRWFWEMDGNKKAQWAENPASYTDAWRRIVDLFRAQGATNAVWVWCPNASAFDDNKAMAWYPGPDHVDWICADGYNFSPNRGDKWENFDEIFDHFYREGAKLNKPMMIGEFGVLEDPAHPGRKGEWFHIAHDMLAQKYPAIAALVYFNADSTTNGIYYNWRVNTSESSYEGFRYLFTGPAPVPQSPPPTSPPATAPPATAPPDTSPPTTRPPRAVTPRPSTPRPATPRPAVTPTTQPAPAPASRQPSPRLTWVLSILRHLDSITVPSS